MGVLCMPCDREVAGPRPSQHAFHPWPTALPCSSHTFERQAIEEHLELNRRNPACPLTRGCTWAVWASPLKEDFCMITTHVLQDHHRTLLVVAVKQ